MSIEVRHDRNGNSMGLELLMQLLGQGAPQAPQAPQAGPIADLLEKLAPATAARQRGSAPPQPGAVNGDSAPSYQLSDTGDEPQYTHYARPRGQSAKGVSVNSLLGNNDQAERLDHQDQLAQFNEQNREARQADREQQQFARAASVQDAEMARWADTIPAQLQSEVSAGHYKYSPAQQREMDNIKNSISEVDLRSDWSQGQKQQFKNQQYTRYHAIRVAPQPVSPEQWPVTPQQQFESSIVSAPDPVTGKPVSGFMGMRSGSPDFKPFKNDEDKIAAQQELAAQKAADAQQRFEQQQQTHVQQINNITRAHQLALRNSRQKNIQQIQSAIVKAEVAKAKAIKDAKDDPFGDGKPPDTKAYDDNINQLKAMLLDRQMEDRDEKARESEDLIPLPSVTTVAPQGDAEFGDYQASAAANPPPVAAPAPVDDAEMGDYQASDGSQDSSEPALVQSRADLEALPSGSRFILPDGRPGTRH